MKRVFAVLALAASASAADADEQSDHWFNDGVAYYQHPCGYRAWLKYGKRDTPENRAKYYKTLRHPEMCSRLFP